MNPILIDFRASVFNIRESLEKNKKLALPTKHSTAKQAADIANKARVGKLILGHYSTRYDDLEMFITEAQTIFKNVELAEDGKTFEF